MINLSNLSKNNSNPYMQLINQNPIQPPQLISNPIDKIEETNTLNTIDNLLLKEVNNNLLRVLEKKQKNQKNTYFKITRNMFDEEIIPTYPDFPLDKMGLIYSNGNDFFIEIGKKKYPLNKKYFLKFINYILK